MDFDWYSSTLQAGPDEVLGVFEKAFGLWSVEPARGMHSYAFGADIKAGRELVAKAFWGGVNGPNVHVQASGHTTPQVVSLVRSEWPRPQHHVSRADARSDYSHTKAWRWLSKIGIEIAETYGVRTSTVGDWIHGKQGRTLYIGGKTSRVQVRIYEKGKQLGVDPNWVRLEVQVRPQGEGKANLADVDAAQLMQCSPWTSALAERVGVPELQAVRIRNPWTQSDDERALKFLVKQYGAVLERTARAVGGAPQLGEKLLAMVESQKASKH